MFEQKSNQIFYRRLEMGWEALLWNGDQLITPAKQKMELELEKHNLFSSLDNKNFVRERIGDFIIINTLSCVL